MLARLPGQPGPGTELRLRDTELRVDAILRQASGRPPSASGGLVSLAECTSDMAHHACSPRDAFRCAQQWMLDPCRTAPPEMPLELASHTRAGGLSKVIAWAAFVHQGR